ncbi:MAG: hypothetical protein WAM28_05165 [Chlamydiales bacterium]
MEWFNELVGFLIIIFLFFFPLLRKWLLSRHKKRTPQEEAPSAMEMEEEFELEETRVEIPQYVEEPPKKSYATQRLVKKDYEMRSEVEAREFESKIEARHLQSKVAPKFKERIVSQAFILTPIEELKKENRILAITQRYPPAQAMIILSEILGRSREFPQ